MENNFERQIAEGLKKAVVNIQPPRSLLGRILFDVTSSQKMRYTNRKGVFNKINEFMNTKLKVFIPAALVLLLVIGGGLALNARHSNQNGSQNVSQATQGQNDQALANGSAQGQAQTKVNYQPATGNPDQIYNELVSQANAEQTISQQDDASASSVVNTDSQNVKQLNNAYDESQF